MGEGGLPDPRINPPEGADGRFLDLALTGKGYSPPGELADKPLSRNEEDVVGRIAPWGV